MPFPAAPIPPATDGPLTITLAPAGMRQGRALVVVAADFAFHHPAFDPALIVPFGFASDFASVPRLFHRIVTPFGRHAAAAVIHDYLYALGAPARRADADRVFADAMTTAGVDPVRRTLMTLAVRLFGNGGYGRPQDWLFLDPLTGAPLDPHDPRRPDRASTRAPWRTELPIQPARRRFPRARRRPT